MGELKYQKLKGRNREELIREIEPAHSKTPNEKWYVNYDKIFWERKKTNDESSTKKKK